MFQQILNKIKLFLPRFFAGIVIFLLFWLAACILKKVVRHIFERTKLTENVSGLLSQIIKVSLLLFGAITALGTMGINVSALVAGLGLTGFALGFAFKDVLSNLIAGVLILVYRPFEPGDTIKVAGFEGRVLEISLRYTTLEADDKRVLIPNSRLMTDSIVIKKK